MPQSKWHVHFCYGQVASRGLRPLMLGFDGNSGSFVAGWHKNCGCGGGTGKLILTMWVNRCQCGIIITIIKKENQNNKAGGSDVGVHPCSSWQINNKPIKTAQAPVDQFFGPRVACSLGRRWKWNGWFLAWKDLAEGKFSLFLNSKSSMNNTI